MPRNAAQAVVALAQKDAPGLAECAGLDPVLQASSFVVLVRPRPGERVASPFVAEGCSSTFEANVVWELRARDGRVLASHFTSGGSSGDPKRFHIEVHYDVEQDQLGVLEIFEPDESDGEGFPPPRIEIPLVLGARVR